MTATAIAPKPREMMHSNTRSDTRGAARAGAALP